METTTATQCTKAYCQGQESALDNGLRASNPYDPKFQDILWDQWDEGWHENAHYPPQDA